MYFWALSAVHLDEGLPTGVILLNFDGQIDLQALSNFQPAWKSDTLAN
jgi:hypothetical protein